MFGIPLLNKRRGDWGFRKATEQRHPVKLSHAEIKRGRDERKEDIFLVRAIAQPVSTWLTGLTRKFLGDYFTVQTVSEGYLCSLHVSASTHIMENNKGTDSRVGIFLCVWKNFPKTIKWRFWKCGRWFFFPPHPQVPPSSARTRRFAGFDSEVLKIEIKADMDFFFMAPFGLMSSR